LNPSLSAVALSIATSLSELGQRPLFSFSGLNRVWEKSTPKPNAGAPPVSTTFPSLLRILAAEASTTSPVAASTLGCCLTSSSSVAGTDGLWLPSPSNVIACLPLITASVPWYCSVKMFLNAPSIAFVSTSVPLVIATPSTIANAVRTARSFRPARPRSATRIT
jgi:hypothetical protein